MFCFCFVFCSLHFPCMSFVAFCLFICSIVSFSILPLSEKRIRDRLDRFDSTAVDKGEANQDIILIHSLVHTVDLSFFFLGTHIFIQRITLGSI